MSIRLHVIMQSSDDAPPKVYCPARLPAAFLTREAADAWLDEQTHKLARTLRIVEFSDVPQEGS